MDETALRPLIQRSPRLLTQVRISPIITDNGFPPLRLTEQTIVQVLRDHGGSVRIRDEFSGWNIYDEIAARLGVSIEARRRLTMGTGEPASRPEVGYARKNLEQRGVIEPTERSGRGTWTLARGVWRGASGPPNSRTPSSASPAPPSSPPPTPSARPCTSPPRCAITSSFPVYPAVVC